MTELFEIPVSLSPRRAWMEKHGVLTHHTPDMEDAAWCAWDAGNRTPGGIPRDPEACGYGATEDEAILDLSIKMGAINWNDPAK